MAITRLPKPVVDSYFVMGVDASTLTGVVVFEVQGLQLIERERVLIPQKGTGLLRSEFIASGVAALVDKYTPRLVAMEGYGYGNKHTLALMVEIGTLIRQKMLLRKIPYLIVPPNNLKQFVLGKGTGAKEIILMRILKLWGQEIEDNNVGDAYVLARLAAHSLGVDQNINLLQAKWGANIDLKKQDCYHGHKEFLSTLRLK